MQCISVIQSMSHGPRSMLAGNAGDAGMKFYKCRPCGPEFLVKSQMFFLPVLTSSNVCLQSISASRVANVLAVSSAFLVPFSLVGAITRMIKRVSWLVRPKLVAYLSLAIATYLFCTDGNEHLEGMNEMTTKIIKW